ncbi:lipase chaperone [Kitasatospora phosalacinea]|uniref:Tat pathway signal sequence domain protein n=1 Tax=Kitasatospora phosalacinea TaxID=2065 RepID=A0A9W6PMG5_9ACTN|nr:lipase chaperone [Kitasatospora phosalacinea]GLW57741.1 hypothetical protein Kpho01_57520 [Kitasatospora phosalacinea]
MSRTTSVRRAARLALVPAVVAGVLALPGAVAFADTAEPTASPAAASPTPTAAASPTPTAAASPTPTASASAVPAPTADPTLPSGLPEGSMNGTGPRTSGQVVVPVNGSMQYAVGGSGPLPRGGAQTGEGAVDRGSAAGLVVGGGLAAAGAAGVGLLVVRRRADARA